MKRRTIQIALYFSVAIVIIYITYLISLETLINIVIKTPPINLLWVIFMFSENITIIYCLSYTFYLFSCIIRLCKRERRIILKNRYVNILIVFFSLYVFYTPKLDNV